MQKVRVRMQLITGLYFLLITPRNHLLPRLCVAFNNIASVTFLGRITEERVDVAQILSTTFDHRGIYSDFRCRPLQSIRQGVWRVVD